MLRCVCGTAVWVVAAGVCLADTVAVRLDAGTEKAVSMRRNDTLEIRAPAQPSTGFSWKISFPQSPILTVVGDRYEGSSDGKRSGGTSMQIISLRPNKTGVTDITLTYVRPWEKAAAPHAVARLSVTISD
jgi:inhibitor of cysteine peptidase